MWPVIRVIEKAESVITDKLDAHTRTLWRHVGEDGVDGSAGNSV
jgi:hypothetical protein